MRKIWLAFLAALSLTVFVAMPATAASDCPLPYLLGKNSPQSAPIGQTAQSKASCTTCGGANNGAVCKTFKFNCGSLQNLNLNDLLASLCNR